jgi:hypothetical protein
MKTLGSLWSARRGGRSSDLEREQRPQPLRVVSDVTVRAAKLWGKREHSTVRLRKCQVLLSGPGSDGSVGRVPLRRTRRTTQISEPRSTVHYSL